jgi:hypothetical protein
VLYQEGSLQTLISAEELEDPVLGRKLEGSYRVLPLPLVS